MGGFEIFIKINHLKQKKIAKYLIKKFNYRNKYIN
jgi:hypothetical protein